MLTSCCWASRWPVSCTGIRPAPLLTLQGWMAVLDTLRTGRSLRGGFCGVQASLHSDPVVHSAHRPGPPFCAPSLPGADPKLVRTFERPYREGNFVPPHIWWAAPAQAGTAPLFAGPRCRLAGQGLQAAGAALPPLSRHSAHAKACARRCRCCIPGASSSRLLHPPTYPPTRTASHPPQKNRPARCVPQGR